MKVLWFTKSPSHYLCGDGSKGYNGLGWVSSLEDMVKDKVSLGIAFPTGNANDAPKTIDGVEYYPVFDPSDNKKSRIKKLLFGHSSADRLMVAKYLEVAGEFKPDVIQVFGSEYAFGLIADKVTCPVILHVQGLLGPCYETYLPGSSWFRYILSAGSVNAAFQRLYTRSRWRHAVKREAVILSKVNNYLCRTAWDKEQVLKANPTAMIFHGEEVLRPVFYEAPQWVSSGGRPVILTTISEAPYKGMDLVLRTGKLLKENGLDFEWKVFGNVDPSFFQKTTGITCHEAGVTLCGVVDADTLAAELAKCSVYVHPSYIENSCNSVCEAQMLGVPVIAANVGGILSLISEGRLEDPSSSGSRTGYLFPAGDASSLATIVASVIADAPDRESLSVATRASAQARHDRTTIATALLSTWQSLASAQSPKRE